MCLILIMPMDHVPPIGLTMAAQPPPFEGGITFWDGDWNVDSDAVYRNQTIIVNGNLTVLGGFSLTLINVTLRMNNTGNMSTFIHVDNGASLTISDYDNDPFTTEDGCIVTSNITDDMHRFGFFAHQNSGLSVINSEISHVGHDSGFDDERGIYIHTTNAVFKNSTISNGHRGINVFEGSGAIIENCRFHSLGDENLRIHSTSDALIFNNTMEVTGNNNYGVYIESNSWRNKVMGNTINVSGGNSEGIRDASSGRYNDLVQNKINITGSGADGIRVFSTYTNITSNSIWVWNGAGDGIQLSFGGLINISDNDIVASGVNICGIQIGNVDNITLLNNKITINQDNCRGMDLGFSAHDLFMGNLTITVTSGINNFGIFFDDVYDVTIANSSITGAQTDMDLNSDSHVVALNTSFSSFDVSDALSDLTVKYYLDLTVEDWMGVLQQGALVQIENATGDLVFSGLSDANGQVRFLPLTEVVYYQSGSIFETPHNITVTSLGYDPWDTQVSMDQNRAITATLLPEGVTSAQRRGDWWIDTTEEYWNTTYLMDGNITINATGNLILNNCTIMFNCTNFSSQYHLNVTWGGELHVFDNDWDNYTINDASIITDSPYDIDDGSPNDYVFSFYAWAGSTLEIRNSHIIDCGWDAPFYRDSGIYVEANLAVFNHAYIRGSFIGIIFADSLNSIVKNSTIIINGYSDFSCAIRAWGCPNLQILYNNIDISTTLNDDIGIFVGFSQGTTIEGNIVNIIGPAGWNYGISLAESNDYFIANNTILLNSPGVGINFWLMDRCQLFGNQIYTFVDFGSGISASGLGNSTIDNHSIVLNGEGTGVYLDGFMENTLISDLSVTSNAADVDGVYIGGGHWATFSDISIDLQGVGSYGFTTINSENITIFDLNVNIPNTWGGGLIFNDGSRNIWVYSAQVFTDGFIPALYANNCSDIWIYNSTLDSASSFDVEVVNNALVTLINPTFADYTISEPLSTLTVMWYLHVRVIDEFGQSFPGINVRIEQADATEVRTGMTNINGWFNWTACVGYFATESDMFNSTNPHTVRAYNLTCWDEVQIDLSNSNRIEVIALINEDPVISDPIFNIQVQEDSTYNRTFHATDFEGNPLAWSISPLEVWININFSSGILTITPTDDNMDTHDFTIRVTDLNGGYDEFMVSVEVINRPPEILTPDVTLAFEDILYLRDYDSDDDPNTEWKLENGPTWLDMDGDTGILSGTPDNSHVGVIAVNISVRDNNGDITYSQFNLWVFNTKPIISTSDVLLAYEDSLYLVDYDSSDDGQGNITWSLLTDASWLTINPTTGILSGTPTNLDIGSWSVNITVDDGNWGKDFSNFTVSVFNTPPTITTTDNPLADEDSTYSVNYASTDDGLGTISWSLFTDASWLSLNASTGVLSGTPRNEHVGIFWVNVTVDDGHGGVGFSNFSLTVNNINDAPVISTLDVPDAVEDQLYFVDYEADDDDQDSLIWSLTTSTSWLSIDPTTGELSGTPSNLDVGLWDVTVSCNDGNGGIDSHSFTIDVTNVNDAPQITSYQPSETFPSVEEGMTLDFNISYSDEDSTSFTINWILDDQTVRQNVPFLSYQPPYGSAGDHEIIVNVTDSAGASVEKSWIVIVTPANRAPVIDSYEPMNLKPVMDPDGSDLAFNVSASDPDSDTLTYQWFVNGNDTGVRSSTFTMDRANYDDGNYDLEVRVIDENGTVTSQNWDITIQPQRKEEQESSMLLPILAIAIAVIVALLLAYLWKKKQSEIEDVFIISNEGMLLAHKSKEIRPDMDDDILGSMLTAVQDFVKESFKDKSKFGLKRLDFGDSVIHIKRGKHIYTAVILSGKEPTDLDDSLGKLVTNIETKYEPVLESWDGNMEALRGLKDMLDDLLK
ncbi:MAG: putative Ig domain-containing protein [Thermoplasmata archaeon]|nr:MAG: putative Ig domain-containing protein [Thermoplasmata archaeon]